MELIHIGKCGGSTVEKELTKNNIPFIKKHLCIIKYDSSKKYLIVIRNPIKRFISAFYWRRHLVCESKQQEHRFPGEKEFLTKYNTIEKLIENLDSNMNYIHHIKEDIHYYLSEFINKCSKENIKGVICTETLSEDMDKLFSIKVCTHEKNNNSSSKNKLSDMHYSMLKKYLWKDYEIIRKLYEKQIIDKNKYEFLSL
jgi:hypothetical protein